MAVALALATCEDCDMFHLVVLDDGEEVVSVPIPDGEWDKLFANVGMAQSELKKRERNRDN